MLYIFPKTPIPLCCDDVGGLIGAVSHEYDLFFPERYWNPIICDTIELLSELKTHQSPTDIVSWTSHPSSFSLHRSEPKKCEPFVKFRGPLLNRSSRLVDTFLSLVLNNQQIELFLRKKVIPFASLKFIKFLLEAEPIKFRKKELKIKVRVKVLCRVV